MTKLDALLSELEKLDVARTPGPFSTEHIKRLHAEYYNIQQPDTEQRYIAVHSSKEDAAFIATVANALPVLLKVIKVQRAALEEIAEWCAEVEHTDECRTATQAIEQTEKLVSEK